MNIFGNITGAQAAAIKIFYGATTRELTDLYPVLLNLQVTVPRNGPGLATMEFSLMRDENGRYPVLDNEYFTRWQPITIAADFGTHTEDIITGYVIKVTPEFPEDRGSAKVTIEIQDETIAMDRESISKTWNEQDAEQLSSDRAIIEAIANKYRFTLDQDCDAGLSPRPLAQNATDFAYITERASKLGYEFRVNLGVIYFGPINLAKSVLPKIMLYAGPNTNAMEFGVDEDGAVANEAQLSMVAGEGETEAESFKVTPNLRLLGRDSPSDEAPASLPDYTWTMEPEGDVSRSEAEISAQSQVNEASMSIKAECLIDSTFYGHVVQPGAVVEIDGVGVRYGHEYYVDEIVHVFDVTRYTQKLSLLKNGLNGG